MLQIQAIRAVPRPERQQIGDALLPARDQELVDRVIHAERKKPIFHQIGRVGSSHRFIRDVFHQTLECPCAIRIAGTSARVIGALQIFHDRNSVHEQRASGLDVLGKAPQDVALDTDRQAIGDLALQHAGVDECDGAMVGHFPTGKHGDFPQSWRQALAPFLLRHECAEVERRFQGEEISLDSLRFVGLVLHVYREHVWDFLPLLVCDLNARGTAIRGRTRKGTTVMDSASGGWFVATVLECAACESVAAMQWTLIAASSMQQRSR